MEGHGQRQLPPGRAPAGADQRVGPGDVQLQAPDPGRRGGGGGVEAMILRQIASCGFTWKSWKIRTPSSLPQLSASKTPWVAKLALPLNICGFPKNHPQDTTHIRSPRALQHLEGLLPLRGASAGRRRSIEKHHVVSGPSSHPPRRVTGRVQGKRRVQR